MYSLHICIHTCTYVVNCIAVIDGRNPDPILIAQYNLDNTGWKAAHEVYGVGVKHLLCWWHVDKYVVTTTTLGTIMLRMFIRS